MNRKLVVVNGMSRGGSNLMWNIAQSHPELCSPQKETYTLLWKGKPKRTRWMYKTQMLFAGIFYRSASVSRKFHWVIDTLFKQRQNSIDNISHNERFPNVMYSKEEIESSILCIKSTDSDLLLNPFFDKVFDQAYFVFVIRHPDAILEGWSRRKKGQIKACAAFALFCFSIFLHKLMRPKNVQVFTLKQIASDPFGVSSELFRGLCLEQVELENIRLKSKRVVNLDGSHEALTEHENSKKWYSSDEISEVLSADIDYKQRRLLVVKNPLVLLIQPLLRMMYRRVLR